MLVPPGIGLLWDEAYNTPALRVGLGIVVWDVCIALPCLTSRMEENDAVKGQATTN
jgi:hypothetical protein